jgi:hypothetical protein
LGYGVLIYFGYPQAHEDAERAVRVGLGLIAAVSGLKTRAIGWGDAQIGILDAKGKV